MTDKQLTIRFGLWGNRGTRHWVYQRIYWPWLRNLNLPTWTPFCWRERRVNRIVMPKSMGKQGQSRHIFNWEPKNAVTLENPILSEEEHQLIQAAKHLQDPPLIAKVCNCCGGIKDE